MRFILIGILLSRIVLLGASSCATVPKETLDPGEVRLLSINVLGVGIEANSSFAVNVFFKAAGNQNIKRACFYEPGEKPYCFDISDASYVTLGTKRAFQVYLPGVDVGSHRLECYAEYVVEGVIRKSNVVFTQILTGTQS